MFDNNNCSEKLHIDSVRKNYGNKQVLTDIYLSCDTREIIGLLGRNGSGKSTLLKIIFGSLTADSKFVRVGDKLIDGIFSRRKLINYLPQHSFLPGQLNVLKIISLFCDTSSAILVTTNNYIQPLVNYRINQLSGGERRLIEIFLIIYSKAKFILIDEPFNGIAPIYIDEIKRLIKELSLNKGFIITDHAYRDILDIATKVLMLHDGGIKEIKNRDELQYWGYIPESKCIMPIQKY